MTFLNPWFLLGGVLAAVPIVIHLWYRRRLKRMPFSTLRFLRQTEAKRFGWLRLREWLILAGRCLLIIFLFMALARPQVKGNLFGTSRLASVCLIVDNSYSMFYGDNFEKAKSLVRQIVARYSPRSEFCLVTLCAQEDEESFWMTRSSLLAAVNNVRLGYETGSIMDAMGRALTKEARYDLEYVYVGDGQSDNFRGYPSSVAERAQFYWVSTPSGSNIGIAGVTLKDPLAIAGDEYELRSTLINYSLHTWSGKLGVTSEDYYLEQECTVRPGTESIIDIALPGESRSGTVELFDDSLVLDNIYYFSKSLLRSINVLLVGENTYLINALASGSSPSGLFRVDNTSQIGGTDLRRYDLVILNRLPDLSDAERVRLLNHVNVQSTALMLIMGDDAGENTKSIVADWCRFEGRVVPRGYVTVDWFDRGHPVFTVFGSERGFGDVQYFQYTKVRAEQGVLARFSGGDPFVVVKDNMCVITGALDAQSTNFVFKNSFVPFLLRLVMDLVSDQYRGEYQVGDRLMDHGSVRAPNGELLMNGEAYFMPGFHTAEEETLCVNVDPGEGDLRLLGKERAEILGVRIIDPEHDLLGSDLTNLFLILALIAVAFELGLLLLR
ncbi:MAG: BatA domain-containing protein [candidate division WOR-3 bacterium]|jgi:hypothetical protein